MWSATSATLLLAGCDSRESGGSTASFKSLDITGADYGRHLDLPDFNGRERHLGDFAGKLVVVFFGYTQCPDVCPTTLAALRETQQLLGADGDRLVGVFVTVDPQRDTAALLKDYVGSFNPDWVALRGSPDQIAAAAREFKVFYRKVPGPTETSYTMDHTAASYVIDTRGRIRLYVRHNTPPQELAADLRVLLAQGG
ncbi:protein SCO1/2 [Sphaerotilus hippei]|uniref:Protein SCO1/2 n=1 Tax=Sphaerotilus hippei TaxID=744406 RepID=A0A318GZU2_9BURK|nr:SCO family protein [Sphaerotilus hippei]PXW95772.1 protein SCO1/2 [Sphaerotilus hippei]